MKAYRPSLICDIDRGEYHDEMARWPDDEQMKCIAEGMVQIQMERVRRETNGTYGKEKRGPKPKNTLSDEFIYEVCEKLKTMKGPEVSKMYGKSPSWYCHIRSLGRAKGFI